MTVEGLAWALLHSVWQGALIAGIGGLVVRVLHGSPAEHRYRALGLLLVAQLAAFAATIAWLAPLGADRAAVPFDRVTAPAGWPLAIVVGWTGGVAVLGIRVAVGLWTIRRWRRRSIAAPPDWAARFERLALRLAVHRDVALRLVADDLGPMAVGVVRPVVLIPAALLVQLPPAQLEAILLHELAHVKRLDWLVNLAQSAAETLLFHHPATWWLSRRIRHERELCCDALAARAVSDPLLYARALAELDALRVLPLSLAANGGNLMDRILRLVGAPLPPHRNPWVVPAVVIGTALGGLPATASTTPPAPDDALVATDPDETEERDEDDADRERPVQPEDVGATVLEMLADKLDEGAQALES
ncbi:MAG: M56 family metallopeptidase, partial [Myxococcota bacterium]